MSHRFPPIPPAEQSPAQRVADVMLSKMLGENPAYEYKDDNGCLTGPYAVLLYNPTLIEPWLRLAASVTKQETFSPREQELVILAVTAVYDPPYMLYAHTLIAKRIGLSQEQITSASKAEIPNELTLSELVAYQTALEMANGRKQLSEASWERACEVLGREKTASVAHLVSGYVYVAILLNVGAIEAPK